MSNPSPEPDVWSLLFEQTPVIFRWALYILSGGFLGVLSILWRWQRKDMQRLENRMDQDRQEWREEIHLLRGSIDETNSYLKQIAQNTGNR